MLAAAIVAALIMVTVGLIGSYCYFCGVSAAQFLGATHED